MTMKFVTEYIDKKVNENKEFIRYTFYELRVKNNLSEEEVEDFLDVNKDYFENKGYKVYFTGDNYEYNGEPKKVEQNELMIVVKNGQ